MRIRSLSFIVLFLIIFFLLVRHSECNQMSPPFTGYSRSIEESKDKGVFQFEVATSKDNLALDSGHKLEIKKAWLENVWTSQVYVIGKTTIEKHDSYQLILVYDIVKTEQSQTPDLFYFLGGRPSGDSLVHYFCDKNDTFNVPLYKEPSRFLPSSEKRKAFDSIPFVRR